MILEERRSVIRHILLNIITLGIYGLYMTRELARDTNVACYGDGRYSRFGKKEIALSVVTLGVYQAIWMTELIGRWNSFKGNRGGRVGIVNPTVYLVCRLSVVALFVALSSCYDCMSQLCEDFNDRFCRLDDGELLSQKTKQMIEETAEARNDADNRVAGYSVVEEYDFNADRRWVDRSAEEAARAVLLAELEAEERRAEEEKAVKAAETEERLEKEKEIESNRAHRNKRWFNSVFPLLLIIFLLPIIFLATVTLVFPPVYDDTFVGELGHKFDRLNSIDEEKVVVIGGSSVAFGLDSAMMEEALDKKVVNFGLYANLGTKLMLDLSKSNINSGDIIIIAPEMNEQTLSLYFNAETAIQAMDGNFFSMIPYVGTDDYQALVGAMWKFSGDKLNYIISDTLPVNSGAYRKECFNEYGDNTFERPYNTMVSTEKTISLNFRTNYNDSITTEYEEFIDYVNEYVAYCNKRGATVYFSFAPMNQAAMTDYNTSENVYNFYKNLCSSLDCKVISDITKCIMDEGYFFDSEFHLNDAGVTVRTANLIDDIKRELGKATITLSRDEIPKPPGFAPVDFAGGEGVNLHFILEKEMVGSKDEDGNDIEIPVWAIVGLNDEGMIQQTLEIPNNIDGIPVAIIRANAFAGSLLETLHLGDNISNINTAAFGGASCLKSVYLPASKNTPDSIGIPNKGPDDNPKLLATYGAPDSMKIYVPQSGLEFFKSDYFWGDYNRYLVGYEPEK